MDGEEEIWDHDNLSDEEVKDLLVSLLNELGLTAYKYYDEYDQLKFRFKKWKDCDLFKGK